VTSGTRWHTHWRFNPPIGPVVTFFEWTAPGVVTRTGPAPL